VILIDTYNVLHTPGVLPLGLAGLDVDGLCRLIATGRYASREITLVCDGHGKDTRRGTMHVVFAADSGDADSWIESRLARDSAPRRLLVVSSDRRVRRAADKAGAAVLSSATFLAQLAIDLDRKKPKPRPRFATDLPLDALSVAYWAGQFGLSREEMTRLDEESRAISPSRREREPAEAPRQADVNPRESGPGNGDPGKTKSVGMPKSPPAGSEPRTAPALGAGLPPPAFDARALADDPVIRSALEHWSGRLSLDDLDMSRWIDHSPSTTSTDAGSNRGPASGKRSREKA
jgi:predicted RNA-binding protein with PIN domain